MPPHPLINFEIQKYYRKSLNFTVFKGIYSRSNSSKTKDRAYIINLDQYELIGTHWTALCANDNNATFFDSFGVEHIPKEIKQFTGNKNIITNIYRE